MGQSANNNRNANLDDKKKRAAGRSQHDPAREAIKDNQSPLPAKGKTAGATGSPEHAHDTAPPPGGGGVKP
jgi:hypothetical protein